MSGKHKDEKPQVKKPREPGQKEKKAPLWNRPLVWVGSVITALVIAAATAFGTGVGQDLFSTTFGHHGPKNNRDASTGLPISIDSAVYVQSVNDGFTFAFPQKLTVPQATAFNSLPVDWQSYLARANSLGGSITGDAAVQIVLRGNAASTTVITGMQVVRHCTTPLTGTLLESPSAGSDQAIQAGFNLDDLFPMAQNYQSGMLSGNFFASHTISLRKGETQSLVVHAQTRRRYCQFTFQIQVDTAHGRVTESITNNGRSFAVTAVTRIESYKALFAGGVISPTGNDAFVPVSAKTLARISGMH